MSRCASCGVILTAGELMFDLPDGTMNDICWTCQPIIDDPDIVYERTYQFEDLTEVPIFNPITAPKPLND